MTNSNNNTKRIQALETLMLNLLEIATSPWSALNELSRQRIANELLQWKRNSAASATTSGVQTRDTITLPRDVVERFSCYQQNQRDYEILREALG